MTPFATHVEDRKLYCKLFGEELKWFMDLTYPNEPKSILDLDEDELFDVEELTEFKLESVLSSGSAEIWRKMNSK